MHLLVGGANCLTGGERWPGAGLGLRLAHTTLVYLSTLVVLHGQCQQQQQVAHLHLGQVVGAPATYQLVGASSPVPPPSQQLLAVAVGPQHSPTPSDEGK